MVLTKGFNIPKEKMAKIIWDYFMITIGSLLSAFSYQYFLVPQKIVCGGASGVATVLYYMFHIPVGVGILMVNIPLLIWGSKEFGGKFAFRTVYAIFAVSFFADMMEYNWGIHALNKELLLSVIYGSIILGVGLGIVFKYRGTTGGSDVGAQIMSKYTGITPGTGIMIIDFFVISSSYIYFKDIDLIFYGFMSLYISSKVLDVVLEGMTSYNKAAYIITDEYHLIKSEIMHQLGRGGTILEGEGFYSGQKKRVLFCVVSRRELSHLIELVKLLDPAAFMVITDSTKVLGKGFTDWRYVEVND